MLNGFLKEVLLKSISEGQQCLGASNVLPNGHK